MNETPQEYTQRMLGLIKGTTPLAVMRKTPQRLTALLRRVPRRKLTKRPAPGTWSAGEILAHMADTELVFGFRMRLIAGTNGTPIQGFDQDRWAAVSHYEKHDPALSLAAFLTQRKHNLQLWKLIDKHVWENHGIHSERGVETLFRLSEMVAGHDVNHVGQIERMLRKEAKGKTGKKKGNRK